MELVEAGVDGQLIERDRLGEALAQPLDGARHRPSREAPLAERTQPASRLA